MGSALHHNASGASQSGLCSAVPSDLADLLWGLEEPSCGDAKAGYELRRAGVRLCELCPLQHHCLALSVVSEAQNGIQGGLPLKARRQLKRRAKAVGIDFDSRSSSVAVAQVQRWLDVCPEEIAGARNKESEQRHERYVRQVAASRRRAMQQTRPSSSRPIPSRPNQRATSHRPGIGEPLQAMQEAI